MVVLGSGAFSFLLYYIVYPACLPPPPTSKQMRWQKKKEKKILDCFFRSRCGVPGEKQVVEKRRKLEDAFRKREKEREREREKKSGKKMLRRSVCPPSRARAKFLLFRPLGHVDAPPALRVVSHTFCGYVQHDEPLEFLVARLRSSLHDSIRSYSQRMIPNETNVMPVTQVFHLPYR